MNNTRKGLLLRHVCADRSFSKTILFVIYFFTSHSVVSFSSLCFLLFLAPVLFEKVAFLAYIKFLYDAYLRVFVRMYKRAGRWNKDDEGMGIVERRKKKQRKFNLHVAGRETVEKEKNQRKRTLPSVEERFAFTPRNTGGLLSYRNKLRSEKWWPHQPSLYRLYD